MSIANLDLIFMIHPQILFFTCIMFCHLVFDEKAFPLLKAEPLLFLAYTCRDSCFFFLTISINFSRLYPAASPSYEPLESLDWSGRSYPMGWIWEELFRLVSERYRKCFKAAPYGPWYPYHSNDVPIFWPHTSRADTGKPIPAVFYQDSRLSGRATAWCQYPCAAP